MGCDGYLLNYESGDGSPPVSVTCYECGLPIANYVDHSDCKRANGNLPVMVEIRDYEER